MKIAKILILAALATGAFACKDDSADNPVFGPQEVFIYDNKPQTMTATQGVVAEWPMVIAPNDNSVSCRWLVNGTVISTEQNLSYAFPVAGGPFTLRFEATKNGFTNYREFKLTVTPAP